MKDKEKIPEEPVSKGLEEAAIEYCGGNKGVDARVRAGFIMGANWQKEQTIKKACEWLENLYAPDGSIIPEHIRILKDFRKAMED